MNTTAALFGFVGSLLLIVQPAIALWLRRDTARTRETLEAGEHVEPGGRGPRLSAVPGAEMSEPRAEQQKAVSPREGFAKVAPELDSGIDAYKRWQPWSMIAGAACLAVSYFFTGFAANLS